MSEVPETPETLYHAAVTASQSGDKAGALILLERAAEAGHPEAGFTLASFILQGIGCDANAEKAAAWCLRSADSGSVQAGLAAALFEARGIGMAENWSAAIARLGALAGRGVAPAQRQLGLLLMMRVSGDADEAMVLEAGHLLHHAAYGGDLMAALALARWVLDGKKMPVELPVARTLIDRVAQAQHPVTRWLGEAIKPGERVALPAPLATPELDDIMARLQQPPIPGTPAANLVTDAPYIARYPGFLSAAECDYLIGMATPQLAPSRIFDPSTGESRPDPYRTSYTASLFPLNQDLVTYAIDLRIAHSVGLPASHGEMLSILAYAPGQEYRAHYDTLTDDNGMGTVELSRSGQRVATFLIGLNGWYKGGETSFPKAGMKARLSVGEGLFFRNTDAEAVPDPNSLHAGLPVTRGMKWLASKWIREKPYLWL